MKKKAPANGKKSIWNSIFTVIVIIAVLIAVFLAGVRILGYKVYNVISPSMAPKYNVGDLIYVKETSPYDVKVGDPITFIMNENLVVATHRVVRIDAENQHFYTKGDANEIEDAEPVHFKNLIGVPRFKIPLLGYVSDFVQHSPGIYITIGVAVAVIAAMFLPGLFRKKKPEQNEAEKGVEAIQQTDEVNREKEENENENEH